MRKSVYGIGACILFSVFLFQQNVRSAFDDGKTQKLRSLLSKSISTDSEWPTKVEIDGKKLNIEYSFDKGLEKFVKRKLKRYRSDFSTVIVLDNNTGGILAAVSYRKGSKTFDRALPFTTTHPSASLFKIVTTASLLESGKLDKEQVFTYRGKGSTLYKYQLKEKITRWTRSQTFAKAFARSNNVIFGKAIQRFGSFEKLSQMANKFGFNRSLLEEFDVSKAPIMQAQNPYELAELATGFNRKTMMSPIHGALLSLIIANDGVLKYPKLVKEVVDSEEEDIYWRNLKEDEEIVISEESAKQIKSMMNLAVEKGTARSSFRRMRRIVKEELELGGKTGSITGGIPYGKHDWFTLFAIPRHEDDRGISVCVLNINVKKWRVKASYLAKEIVNYYYYKMKRSSDEKKII